MQKCKTIATTSFYRLEEELNKITESNRILFFQQAMGFDPKGVMTEVFATVIYEPLSDTAETSG